MVCLQWPNYLFPQIFEPDIIAPRVEPMGLIFEWEEEKAKQNFQKHKVSFEEAATIFGDPLSLTIEDPLHSEIEDRLIIVGASNHLANF